MDLIPLEQLPLPQGLCPECASYGDCPMPEALATHRHFVRQYGESYEDIDPGAWDQHSIDEPMAEGTEMIWCPLYG